MVSKKKRSILEPRRSGAAPGRARLPLALAVRMFVIGAVAVLACAWAVWRHYRVQRPQMMVPAPSASEIEIEPLP